MLTQYAESRCPGNVPGTCNFEKKRDWLGKRGNGVWFEKSKGRNVEGVGQASRSKKGEREEEGGRGGGAFERKGSKPKRKSFRHVNVVHRKLRKTFKRIASRLSRYAPLSMQHGLRREAGPVRGRHYAQLPRCIINVDVFGKMLLHIYPSTLPPFHLIHLLPSPALFRSTVSPSRKHVQGKIDFDPRKSSAPRYADIRTLSRAGRYK